MNPPLIEVFVKHSFTLYEDNKNMCQKSWSGRASRSSGWMVDNWIKNYIAYTWLGNSKHSTNDLTQHCLKNDQQGAEFVAACLWVKLIRKFLVYLQRVREKVKKERAWSC